MGVSTANGSFRRPQAGPRARSVNAVSGAPRNPAPEAGDPGERRVGGSAGGPVEGPADDPDPGKS